MSASLAHEAQSIAFDAAKPIRPGQTIKGQLRSACRALGYEDGHWRIRAAWYGEAGCWSAAAMEDLRGRYQRWLAKCEAKAHAADRTDYARAAALREALAASDPEFHGPDIARLGALMERIRPSADRSSEQPGSTTEGQ